MTFLTTLSSFQQDLYPFAATAEEMSAQTAGSFKVGPATDAAVALSVTNVEGILKHTVTNSVNAP